MNSIFAIFATIASARHSSRAGNPCEKDAEFCGENAINEPIRSCTDGFVYDDINDCCVSEIAYPPLFRCAAAGMPSPDGLCDLTTFPRLTCLDGFVYDAAKHTCVHAERTPMIPSCAHMPLGGTLTPDGRQCEYFKAVESRPRCAPGAKFVDGMCKHFETVRGIENVNMICPDGWSVDYQTRECIIVEAVDCGKTARKVKEGRPCKKNECAFEEFSPCDSDCVFPDHRRLCNGDVCKEKIKPEAVCQATSCKMSLKEKVREPKGSSFVEAVACERVTKLPAKLECPDGSRYNKAKDSCCSEVNVMPEQVCPGGTPPDPTGACPRVMHYAADYVCPMPYEVICNGGPKNAMTAHPSNCECVIFNESPSIPICPDGTVLDPNSKMCFQQVPAIPYCAEAGARLVDGVCVRQEREPVRLEYTVTYVTEKPCQMDECIKGKVPIKKKVVKHREVNWNKGRAHTKCHDVACRNRAGQIVVDPIAPVVGGDQVPIPDFHL